MKRTCRKRPLKSILLWTFLATLLIGHKQLYADGEKSVKKPIEAEKKGLDTKTEKKLKAIEKGTFEDSAMPKGKKLKWEPRVPEEGVDLGAWSEVVAGDENEDLQIVKISVGNRNRVWSLDDDGKIFYLKKKGWVLEETGFTSIDVAVASDGTVLAINDEKDVFERVSKGEWKQVSDLKLDRISVGSKDVMWGRLKKGEEYFLYRLVDGEWQEARNMSGEHAEGFLGISVNAKGIAVAIDEKNRLYRRDLDRIKAIKRTKGTRKKLKGIRKERIKKLETKIKKIKSKRVKSRRDKRRLRKFRRRIRRLKRKIRSKKRQLKKKRKLKKRKKLKKKLKKKRKIKKKKKLKKKRKIKKRRKKKVKKQKKIKKKKLKKKKIKKNKKIKKIKKKKEKSTE